ncbi:Nlrc3 protein, partial [Globisporangium splendens]
MASMPVTPSRSRVRRPSGGPPANGGVAAARSHGQASPRVRMMLKEEEAAASESTENRQEGDELGSKAFLTALIAAKHNVHGGIHRRASRNVESEVLRPPSSLEAADSDGNQSRLAGGGGSGGEPCVYNYMGGEAMQRFWSMFHQHDAVSNNTSTTLRPSSSGTKDLLLPLITRPKSARSTYLSVVRKLQLSPEPMGIVRRRVLEKGASSSVSSTVSSSSACSSGNTTQEINLNSYRMGDTYASAFSQGFPFIPGVESLNLTHNRISDGVAAQIITNAATSLQQLNLAHNKLARISSTALSGLLGQSKTLTSLNLSHNQLKDREIHTLCEALQKNQTLTRLHLSENRFGIQGMLSIAKFLEENAKIEEVYLSWNQIRDLGALKICEALKFHGSLRVVDLSWNSLDSNELLKPRSVVTALADSLANNKVLVHLDLSNNHLDTTDCALLAKQLESNQTLIGFHMSGNCGIVDTRGFLIPKKSDSTLLDQHKMYSIAVLEETHSESGSGVFPPHLAPLVDKYCWYCGQWSEYRFAWQPTHADGPFAASGRYEITPSMGVRLHLCHDGWQAINMEKRDDGSFSAYVVLPPGKTEYFFSVVNRNDTSQISYHFISEKRHSRLVIPVNVDRVRVFGDLECVNVIRIARRGGRDPCNTLVPRSTGKGNERATRWDINKSVFARRHRETVCHNFVDTDTFVTKACAADWRQCKVDRFIKDPIRRKEVENCVTKHFRVISNAYRRYCGHNVLTSLAVGMLSSCSANAPNQLQSDIISVPWSGYIEFLTECRILDETSDYCKLADLENVFVAANLELTQEAKEKDNPDRSLTRFEFLECAIRIAMNKFHRSANAHTSFRSRCSSFLTNICDMPAKAVDKLIQEHISPVCHDDPNEFRTKFLYTEEVSDIFSEHIVMLQDIYNSNMGRYCKPGEKKGMQLAEFLQIMERYQIYNEIFRARDVKDPFLACKLVVLDEMATVGHKKLYMTDFMELLLRISTLRYPPKPLTVPEVAKSLQKLFINHFYKHEEILEQFRETVDQAVMQDRVEAFANAINAHKKKSTNDDGGGKRRGGSAQKTHSAKRPVNITEQDEESDSSEEEDTEERSEVQTVTTIFAASDDEKEASEVLADDAADEGTTPTPDASESSTSSGGAHGSLAGDAVEIPQVNELAAG